MRLSLRTAAFSFLHVPSASTGPDLGAATGRSPAQDTFPVGTVLLVFLTQLPWWGGGGGRGGPSGIAWLTGRGLCFEEKNLGLSPRLHCVPKLFPCHEHENESPQGIMRTNKTKFWYGRHSISDSSETMGIIQVIMPQERVKEMLFPYRWQKSGFF